MSMEPPDAWRDGAGRDGPVPEQRCRPRSAWELLKLPLSRLCHRLSPSEQSLRDWDDGPIARWMPSSRGIAEVTNRPRVAAGQIGALIDWAGIHHPASRVLLALRSPTLFRPTQGRQKLSFHLHLPCLAGWAGGSTPWACFWQRDLGQVPIEPWALVSRCAEFLAVV